MLERLLAKLDEVLCPNNRILGLMKRIQQALSPSGSTSTTSDDLGESIRSVNTDDILERWDEVILQLKRTHLHLFLITGFDGIELDGALILPVKRSRLMPLAIVDDDLADLLHVRESQSSGTEGGTFTSGDWRTRTLNTTITNEIAGSSLGSNQITLPAGTYRIVAQAPAFDCGRHKIKLFDTTNTADLIIGSNAQSGTSDNTGTISVVRGQFVLSGEVVLEIQHRCSATRADVGLGLASSFSVVEVYADVLIRKIA